MDAETLEDLLGLVLCLPDPAKLHHFGERKLLQPIDMLGERPDRFLPCHVLPVLGLEVEPKARSAAQHSFETERRLFTDW